MEAVPNPALPSQWRSRAIGEGINPDTVTPFDRKYRSASNLTLEEFLCLKVLWKQKDFREFKEDDHISEDVLTELGNVDFSELRSLVQAIRNRDPHPSLLQNTRAPPNGLFSTFRYFAYLVTRQDSVGARASPKIARPERPRRQAAQGQNYNIDEHFRTLHLDSTPTTPASQIASNGKGFDTPYEGDRPPQTQYEATVNMGLITMLSAIRLNCAALREGHWLPDPMPFHLRDETGTTILEARVDGYLTKEGADGSTYSIIEVKPFVRRTKLASIEWQEAAQMAAWVSEPGSRGDNRGVMRDLDTNLRQRFMISQDRDEIYLTIAEYDVDYEKYIRGSRSNDNGSSPTYAPTQMPRRYNQPPVSPTPQAGNQGEVPADPAWYHDTNELPSTPSQPRRGTNHSDLGQPVAPPHQCYPNRPLFGRGDHPGSHRRGPDARISAPSVSFSLHSTQGFLRMTAYGPVYLNDDENLEKLCHAIAALSLQVLSKPSASGF